jgi:hypothetical protein
MNLFKSKAYLAEEQEYQNDLAALKQAVRDGEGKSLKEQEALLPFSIEFRNYPITGKYICPVSHLPSTLEKYISAKPPVKQIIDSTEEEGRWEVVCLKERDCGVKTVLKAKDAKLNKKFSFSENDQLEDTGYHGLVWGTTYKDEDDIFTQGEADLLFNVFLSLRNSQEDKIKQAKRQALVELYDE